MYILSPNVYFVFIFIFMFIFYLDMAQQRLAANNIFTVAKRTVDGQVYINLFLKYNLFPPNYFIKIEVLCPLLGLFNCVFNLLNVFSP